MTPRYITRKAAAEHLGVSTTTIDKLTQSGYLRKVRMPGMSQRVLVTVESIEAYEQLMDEQAHRLAIIDGAVA